MLAHDIHIFILGFQNGFWFFKFTSLVGLAVGAFFMPPAFAIYWMYICIAAATVYIVIQVYKLRMMSVYV